MTAEYRTRRQLPDGSWALPWYRRLKLGLTGALLGAALWGPGVASALSFGRLSVQSSLGEPLKAEVQINSITPAEEASLRLRLAPASAYRNAGIEFDEVLSGARVTFARQTDGRPVMQLRTDRPVTNVFVDVLVEARWASGQQVLGYTLLVNPAGAGAPAADGSASTPAVLGSAPPQEVTTASAVAVAPTAGSMHLVQPGETLLKVARQYRAEGVSLDQMLAALFRANPQAFIGSNMNRLKAGAVLALPSPSDLAGVSPAQARDMIEAHSADFGAYRAQLAAAVPKAAPETAASRQDAGRVEARVKDRKSEAAPTPDQLKLSQAGVKAASSPEASLSKQAAAKAAAEREAELLRNMQALKQLQQMAAASAPTGAAVQPAPPADAAPAVAAAQASSPVLTGFTPAAVTAASAAPAASAASGVAASPPADDKGLLESLLHSTYTVVAGAALVALLAALGAYRLWRGRRSSAGATFLASRFEEESASPLASQASFGADLLAAKDLQEDPNPQTLAELGVSGDVDPIAEADVYLSYGRDVQAEEILRDALLQMPDRLDVRVKLLEVLALRKDPLSFEPQALEVHEITGGVGPEWAHVAAMGRALDPDNPLYADGSSDFDALGQGLEDATPPPPEVAPVSTAADTWDQEPAAVEAEDFSLEMGSATSAVRPELDDGLGADARLAPAEPPEVDLGGVEVQADFEESVERVTPPPAEHPLERKLALAHEFMQIGDMEGARDLADEVYAQAAGPLKEKARALLDDLG